MGAHFYPKVLRTCLLPIRLVRPSEYWHWITRPKVVGILHNINPFRTLTCRNCFHWIVVPFQELLVAGAVIRTFLHDFPQPLFASSSTPLS